MYLNMRDPGTFYFTEEFERLGFFFSGILPGASGGEALILNILNNVPFIMEKSKSILKWAGRFWIIKSKRP